MNNNTPDIIEFYCSYAHEQLDNIEKTVIKKLNVISGEAYTCSRYNYWIKRSITNVTGYGGKQREEKDLFAKIIKTSLTYCVNKYKEWLQICECEDKNIGDLKSIFVEHLEHSEKQWNFRKSNVCEIMIEMLNVPLINSVSL